MTSRRLSRPGREEKSLFTSLVLVFPLLLFYSVGVLVTDVMNGADFMTMTLLHLVGLKAYLGIQGGLLVGYLVLVLSLRRNQALQSQQLIPVLLESGIYALTMGTLIIFVMVDLLGIDPRLAAGGALKGSSIFARLVMAAGAGVHEELVFRLLLLNGLSLAADRVLSLRRPVALLFAFVVSSALFSAAHHIGPLGEPLSMGVFVYRAMAGLFFAALFQFRSFAIAVYTHTLYDLYVFLLH